jgi:hypothetical protein
MKRIKLSLIKYCFLLAAIICNLSVTKLQAQFFEGGLLIGGSNYLGDLSGTSINLNTTRPAAGVLLRYHVNDRFTIKGFGGYGMIWGADSLSTKQVHLSRNLSFFTHIIEFSGHIEYNILKFSYKRYAPRPFVPYVFAGIGVFNFNPQTYYNGVVYELQPRATEGQGTTEYNDKTKYNLTQFCIPFGFGVKKRITDRLTLGVEVGARYTFTNYLDDVGGTYAYARVVERAYGDIAGALSDRSIEKNFILDENGNRIPVPLFTEGMARSKKRFDINDIYIFTGLTVTFRLKKNVQCPTFK